MRALQLERLDGPEGLKLVDVPEPEAGDQVLIDVVAAGVSFPDLLLTQGKYQMKPPLPFVPGVDVAGVVRSAPAGSGLKAGDKVMAFTMLGGWADVVAAAPGMTFRIPEGWSFETAAGTVMNYHTAYFALHRRGRLRTGETVMIHGGAGGLGTAAIQVARGSGARVFAVVSTEEKAEVARSAGADRAFLSSGDWVSRVMDATKGKGVGMVFDSVGGDMFDQSIKCLAPEGRLLVVGFASGRIPEVKVNRLLLNNIDVVGVAWGAFVMQKPQYAAEAGKALAGLADKGFVEPVVSKVFPLEQAADALRELESRQATGKVVLRLREG